MQHNSLALTLSIFSRMRVEIDLPENHLDYKIHFPLLQPMCDVEVSKD